MLEDAVVIGIDSLHQQILAGTLGANVHFADIVHRKQGAQLRRVEDDGLIGTGDLDGVADRDGGASRGGQGGEENQQRNTHG